MTTFLVEGRFYSGLNPRSLQGIDQRWVGPSGPKTAAIAFIAEAPAREELKQGVPLVGPSGEINWQLAARYGGVYRTGSYVSNWRKVPFTDDQKKLLADAEKRRAKGSPKPGDDTVISESAEWTEMLWEEIASIDAKTIIVLGGHAVEALLGEKYNLYWANGVSIERGGRVFIPVVHPAAGIHESSMLAKTSQGYAGVKRYLQTGKPDLVWGQWAPEPETVILVGPERSEPWGPEIAIDTEGSKEEPFCLTYDAGSGPRLIWAGDGPALAAFQERLAAEQPLIILHNLMHDASVCRAMGVDVFCSTYTDTMVLAYLLQDVPMGLKDITRRCLGMDMTEYTAVVKPWADRADQDWLGRAMEAAWGHVRLEQQLTSKGKPRVSKGAPVVKKVGPKLQLSLITHLERGQKLATNEEKWAEGVLGQKRPGLELKWVPIDIAAQYAGKDATTTRRAFPVLWKRIQDEGLEVAAALDLAALPLIEDMQQVGLNLDVERYMEVMGHVSTERDKAAAECREIVGSSDFNPGSSEQVEAFCKRVNDATGKLKLEKLTKSRQRFSTDNNVLAKLRDEHPFIPAILRYRELDKYQGTYLLPLGGLLRESAGGHRLNPNLRTTTVVSGRLSAHAPNALAWPSRTKLGKMLRSIFRARAGHILCAWDLSQIELRITAAFSGDEVMGHAFKTGLDLHSNLAANLFGVPYEVANSPENKSTMRDPCKTIHYLLLYGGGGDKLFEELVAAGIKRFTREDCFDLIRDTWKVYNGAGRWVRNQAQEARFRGFAASFLGRRRFLPGTQLVGDRWPILSLRREAERQAFNHPVQAGAGELLKRTEVTVWNEVYPAVKEAGHYFRLWLQVHDELMGETTEAAYPMVDQLMKGAMTQDSWLTAPIPIETDSARGAHWGEL